MAAAGVFARPASFSRNALTGGEPVAPLAHHRLWAVALEHHRSAGGDQGQHNHKDKGIWQIPVHHLDGRTRQGT
jgi:hypothetical protein